MDQHEYVLGCQRYYAENYYEPGNPEDGEWHDCHYPTPQCLGGTKTIKLLKEHHAVQGVLQSEEYQRCCIWSWELAYLKGEQLALAKKWLRIKGQLSGGKGARAVWDKLTPEERSARAVAREAAKSPEQRAEACRTARAGLDEVHTPERRAEAAQVGWETRRANGSGGEQVRAVSEEGVEATYPSLGAAARATGDSRSTVARYAATGARSPMGYTYARSRSH